jgi:drug/metabolite transporter (DMT)-like permease
VGLVLLFAALAATGQRGGSGSVHGVLMITALYPLVASILAGLFLGIPLTPRHLAAIPLAIGAVLLPATDGT